MKIIKLMGIGILTLVFSFFTAFFGLELYKNAGAEDLFRAHTPYDLVIKNARIIDGTGSAVFRGELGIRKGVIMKIAKQIEGDGLLVFDGAGFTIAPNKVEWPENVGWIQRDLATAVLRYPAHRLIVKETAISNWQGRSVKAILAGGKITVAELVKNKNTKVLVAPEMADLEDSNTSINAFYLITGWRGEVLNKNIGKIKEGFPANLIIFNHREIKDNQLLNYLKQEKLPPVTHIIDGNTIKSPDDN